MGSARVSSNLILVVVFSTASALCMSILYRDVGKERRERPHGVMVSTQDSESCDPSSNLGGTSSSFGKHH